MNSTRDLAENDNFSKCYNKELYVKAGKLVSPLDEIPIVLNELNDAAFNYIDKSHFDKALTLLSKA